MSERERTRIWPRFLLSLLLGGGFFLAPAGDSGTVWFDYLTQQIRTNFPVEVQIYCLFLLVGGIWRAKGPFQRSIRSVGFVLGLICTFHWGPRWLLATAVGGVSWGVLTSSVAIIIPLGAAFLNVLVSFGVLEFIGVLMRPVMRPLFRLPGRSALDDLASWLGSYSVGLYLTRKLFRDGYYTRREAFIIVTCFSTVSIGFVGVITSTLKIGYLFSLVFGAYFVLTYLLAIILCRVWPVTTIADTYFEHAQPEPPKPEELFKVAWQSARWRIERAPSITTILKEGFWDGMRLASQILGTILVVGTAALAIAEYTPIFRWLGAPLVPYLKLVGIPEAATVGPALAAGLAEMYLPALLIKGTTPMVACFVAIVSVSQLIFFSSVAPMMLEMFRDLPVKLVHLVGLFVIRTLLLIPMAAAVVHFYSYLGWL